MNSKRIFLLIISFLLITLPSHAASKTNLPQKQSQVQKTLNKNSADTYLNEGLYKAKQKNYTEAIKDFTKAISINPNYTEAYCFRGISKDKLNDHSGAINDYEQAKIIDTVKDVKKKE